LAEEDENVRRSSSDQSAASKQVTRGLKGLYEGVEKTAVAYATGLPTLKDTVGGLGKLGKTVGYLEDQLGVFNSMSQYGVTFGGELEQMTIKATAARMTQEQLTKVIKDQADNMTLFGATANQGLQSYMSAQAAFYDDMPLAATNLRRLGMTTEEINESMLTYDKISRLNNRRDQRSVAERNRSAAAFAEEMDLMAKLQGKSRKEMQAEMEARAREGRIIAVKAGLEADMADALDQNLQKAAAFGPGVEGVMKDMMAMGVPSKDNAKLFAMMGGEAQNAMRAMKAAQDVGDVQEYNRQMQIFMAAMQKRGKDEDVRRMALLGGMNDYSQIAGEVISNTQTGMAGALADARATLEAEVAAGKRRAFTEEEVTQLARERAKAEQDALKNQAGDGETKAVTQTLIDAQMAAFEAAESVQIEATKRLYEGLAISVQKFKEQLEGTDTGELANKALGAMQDISTELTGGSANIQQQIEQARRDAVAQGDVDKLGKLKELEAQLEKAEPQDRAAIESQIKALATSISSVGISTNNAVIQANGTTTVIDNGTGQAKGTTSTSLGSSEAERNSLPKFSSGTVGAFGQLFQDFGKETVAALHGEEMVATKEQMGAGLKAFATELKPGLASMGSQLQGQVSNIKPQMQTMASSMAPQMEQLAKSMEAKMPELQQQMMGFAEQLKGPMENMARNMEEQLTVSKKGVNINNKQLKSAKAMVGNVFGGIGI
jgi:hypothetical protein